MKEEAVYAHRFTGKRYDCGSKLGYLQATVEFALGHPQLGKDFGKYLLSLSRETINSIAAKGNEYTPIDRRKAAANGSGASARPDGGRPNETRSNGGRANGRQVARPAAREVKPSVRRKGATA
jgi:hypothetical protein